MYQETKLAALFFVVFDAATTLYLHSLVLSVVFQTYVQASTEVHTMSVAYREETLRLSFEALRETTHLQNGDSTPVVVQTSMVRRVIEKIRPHYSILKINALMDIYGGGDDSSVISGRPLNFVQYRQQIHQVLNSSIRSAPKKNGIAYAVEIIAAIVAIFNLVYIILLSSILHLDWFDGIRLPLGFVITILGCFELTIRINPFGALRFTPLTKLNPTFDGIAAVAAGISIYGLFHHKYKEELLVTGRAIDVVRIMRFQKIFRDVIRRTGEIFPALTGPLVLLLATNHIFAYVGMALWSGAIHVGSYPNITPLYDQNNFNSYVEVS